MTRRRRHDEWSGYCGHCDGETVLRLRKEGRWTLRQLFTSAWEDGAFSIVCRQCSSSWPAHLHGTALSLPDWLEHARHAPTVGAGDGASGAS